MKRTIRNGDEYHFEKGNKISVKKIHKNASFSLPWLINGLFEAS